MTQPAISEKMLARYNARLPRYTSYPTVPEWGPDFSGRDFEAALARAAEQPDVPLSVYAHIPFCESMCSYCGCNVQISKRVERADPYLDDMKREMQLVAQHLRSRRQVNQLHWGGGTPTFLDPTRLERLWRQTFDHFELAPGAEVSVEVNPEVTTHDHLKALAGLGFNRLSMGVQTFDAQVQRAIHRHQSFEFTQLQTERARALGFGGVNFDLIYGLPEQNRQTWAYTLGKVLEIRPDRLAVFSMAYLPTQRPHQKRLDESAMLTGSAKLDLLLQARDTLLEAGYVQIGFDHFAVPEDSLAVASKEGTLWRNFQGYTTKATPDAVAPDSIAFGVTGISDIAGIYAQTVRPLTRYHETLGSGELPIERGIRLSEDDIARRTLITTLMCNLQVDLGDDAAARYAMEITDLQPMFEDALASFDGRVLSVTEQGRLFLRNIAAPFDARLRAAKARGQGGGFSQAI